MAPMTWPAALPFDPESGDHPPVLEALFARPAATVPAILFVVGSSVRRDEWAVRTAIEITDAWAGRRPAITLADLDLESPVMEARLGIGSGEGIAEIFEFGLSLALASRTVPERRFRFLSPGLYVPEPRALLEDPRWEKLVFSHAEHEATLLAWVPFDAPGLDALARRVGKAIILAGADEGDRIAAALPSNCSVLAVLHRPDDPAAARAAQAASVLPWTPRARSAPRGAPPVDPVAGDPASEEELLTVPTFVRRIPMRRRTSRALVFLFVVALAAGGWFGAEEYLGTDMTAKLNAAVATVTGGRFGANDAAAIVATETTVAAGTPAGDAGAAVRGEGAAPGVARSPLEEPKYYSIAVEAHPNFATATRRVAELRRREPGIPFYLTPIVWDSVIYYRVMAGMASDTVEAGALMRRLHREGHKSDLDPWSIRPTVWTYLIGEFPTREAAIQRADSLLARDVPNYVIEIPYTAGPSVYRIYAGAYEGPGQAELMARLLQEAGVQAKLVQRTGPASE